MKIQLALLLVVLFVSLPSVVFSQPPLGAVQSGETSQTAPTAETVQKSWEGPFLGLGLGLGFGSVEVTYLGESASTGVAGFLPFQLRLGYGLSDRSVLYGSVHMNRGLDSDGEWGDPGGFLGMMFRGRVRPAYGFAALGAGFSSDPVRPFGLRGGYGTEIYQGLAVEGAGTILGASDSGATAVAYTFDVMFYYHFY